MHERILLVLDLDETLIFASETPLDREADFRVYGYHVYRRPWLAEFLQEVSRHFDLAVWSSASDDYVTAVVEIIFGRPFDLRFVWGRSRATFRRMMRDENGYLVDGADHMHYLKPLAKVKRRGWSLERVLIVDDTPAKSVRNYGNAVYPKPFLGDSADRELPLLAEYLSTIRHVENVRTIEKRNWRGPDAKPAGEPSLNEAS